jgi:hypothetical protein
VWISEWCGCEYGVTKGDGCQGMVGKAGIS